jgi:hypothetical protein
MIPESFVSAGGIITFESIFIASGSPNTKGNSIACFDPFSKKEVWDPIMASDQRHKNMTFR